MGLIGESDRTTGLIKSVMLRCFKGPFWPEALLQGVFSAPPAEQVVG